MIIFLDVEIAIERDIYSAIEGDQLEVCVVVVRGTVVSQFEVSAQVDTECKL